MPSLGLKGVRVYQPGAPFRVPGQRPLNDYAAKLTNMAVLQDRHNREVHPEWRTRGYAYYRAVWIECAELLDHFGWKWWKRQEANLEQVRLEVVDIWHFGLSDLLRADAVDEALAARMTVRSAPSRGGTGRGDLRAAVEALALSTLASRAFDVDAFVDLMNAVPMSLDELHDAYIGKNVLNSFRQAHGYRDGSYVKTWGGREDNEHLSELAAQLDAARPSYAEDLKAALEERYAALT